MELIIGGAAQGKLEYVLRTYHLTPDQVSDGVLTGCPAVNHLEDAVRALLRQGKDPAAEVLAYAAAHPDVILICAEVGCGLVPMDAFEREWREAVGRLCCQLAARAHRVVRVFCGMPTLLKAARHG